METQWTRIVAVERKIPRTNILLLEKQKKVNGCMKF